VHADPLTYRAFSKPRGYAGDAVMMDHIYGYRREDTSIVHIRGLPLTESP